MSDTIKKDIAQKCDKIVAYKLNEVGADWVVVDKDTRMLLDTDCVREAVIDYYVKYLSKSEGVEEIEVEDSCVFTDDADALVHISNIVNHMLRVDYADPKNPVLHIDGTDVRIGQVVCKDKNGEIFIVG